MKTDFKKIYMDWLNENIEQAKVRDNLYRITFPYLDRNNDHTEIYIKEDAKEIWSGKKATEAAEEVDSHGCVLYQMKRM